MPELACAGCGRLLLHEQHALPPTAWFATEGVLSIVATRSGWRADRCPDCQADD